MPIALSKAICNSPLRVKKTTPSTSSNSSKSCEIIIIDTPFCDNSTIVFLINASEPASMPHVG